MSFTRQTIELVLWWQQIHANIELSLLDNPLSYYSVPAVPTELRCFLQWRYWSCNTPLHLIISLSFEIAELICNVHSHNGAYDKCCDSVCKWKSRERRLEWHLDLMAVAREALKPNITSTSNPVVLPVSEQILFFHYIIIINLYVAFQNEVFIDFK